MDTSGSPERPVRSARPPRPVLSAIVAAVVIAFGLITTLVPDRATFDPDSIDPAALSEPEIEAGFRVVAELDVGPWRNFRIADAYLYTSDAQSLSMGDGPTVITDDDEVFDVNLPDMEVLFGAIDADEESVAFGRTPAGPALWRSTDNVAWALELLPWEGTVRAGAMIDGRLVLIGIENDGPSFHYVAATETPKGWLVLETTRVPHTGLISVPGGFVGRGTAPDGSGYGYLYSDDGADWTHESNRAAAGSRSRGAIPAFVIETDDAPLLTLPGDERVFAPPEWPISGLWLEEETIWLQTPGSAWSSIDGVDWQEYPINAATGIEGGFSVLLPVGDTARLATLMDDRILLFRWDPGSSGES
jgi:hypothetical protein